MLDTLRVWFLMLVVFALSGAGSYFLVTRVVFHDVSSAGSGGTGDIGYMVLGLAALIAGIIVISLILTYILHRLGAI